MLKKIAEIISFVLNPIVLILFLLILGIEKSDLNQKDLIGYTIGIFILNGLLPLYGYVELLRRKIPVDDILDNKKVLKYRPLILVWGVLLFLLEAVVVKILDKTPPLFYILIVLSALTLLVFTISFFRKISLHMSYATLFAFGVVAIFGYRFWPVLVIIPLIAWSRIYLLRHTPKQLLAGFLAAASIGYLVYILIL